MSFLQPHGVGFIPASSFGMTMTFFNPFPTLAMRCYKKRVYNEGGGKGGVATGRRPGTARGGSNSSSNRGANQPAQTSTGSVTTITGRNIPNMRGTPNSTIRLVDSNGKVIQERHFGPDGRAAWDIDHRHAHHGHGTPHKHVWDWSDIDNPYRLAP